MAEVSLVNLPLVPTLLIINIGSGNGLVPSGKKPLPEPMVTQISATKHQALTGTNVDFLSPRTPDLCIFLAEKMRMRVFGQEREEISAFLYG